MSTKTPKIKKENKELENSSENHIKTEQNMKIKIDQAKKNEYEKKESQVEELKVIQTEIERI